MALNLTFACEDCGCTTTRTRRTGEPMVCFDCGVDRALRANISSHEAARRQRERNNARRAEINATVRRQAQAKARRHRKGEPSVREPAPGGATLMGALEDHIRRSKARATIDPT